MGSSLAALLPAAVYLLSACGLTHRGAPSPGPELKFTIPTTRGAPLHRNLSEITIPGILLHYDVSDLLEAIAPRPVTLRNPVDAIGQPMRLDSVRQGLGAAFESDRNLGYPQRIQLLRRGFRDPLPLE